MALYDGIDPVAFVSGGVYTETYVSATGGSNISSLFVSRGLLEEAPAGGPTATGFFRKILRKVLCKVLETALKTFV